ncbi:WG repeat-containing protein [Xylanibacter rodentium]|uniref:WG repeat-containing protein n=4 Tax=Xylanibacter rodentium TaxID=2736289 RepID=A0ABX2B0C5_9BACT|nr:WG repeat-containing protein [Xylanibacter rodentium]NPE12616.1 WG repeat-containing protein [Prevotella sp. PJ1A]NPE15107.1 WG repeat-containing protein [Xylanibacter rodentium]NPE40046.1 WG repeat-containing protein [Prevotella sp. PCJ2]
MSMIYELDICQDYNGLFGAKNSKGDIVIPFLYKEMYSFSCGLSMVRSQKYEYGYINQYNQHVVPFGKYVWCDSQFVCGYARVLKYDIFEEKNKWGIIDTKGNIIIPLEYDRIWALKEGYLHDIKAFKGEEEFKINLVLRSSKLGVLFDGLSYIATYSVEEFKIKFHCSRIYVKKGKDNMLYFCYGCNVGFVALKGIPQNPVISIVINSAGKIFPLLHTKEDTGKTTFDIRVKTDKQNQKRIYRKSYQKTSFWDYENEKMNDCDNWSDPYGDEQSYYDGWNREDIDSGLADAYENDISALDKW